MPEKPEKPEKPTKPDDVDELRTFTVIDAGDEPVEVMAQFVAVSEGALRFTNGRGWRFEVRTFAAGAWQEFAEVVPPEPEPT